VKQKPDHVYKFETPANDDIARRSIPTCSVLYPGWNRPTACKFEY